jgi:hypothetical protein
MSDKNSSPEQQPYVPTTFTREEIEGKLTLWGAVQSTAVKNAWWLNGHCFYVYLRRDGSYGIEEL